MNDSQQFAVDCVFAHEQRVLEGRMGAGGGQVAETDGGQQLCAEEAGAVRRGVEA